MVGAHRAAPGLRWYETVDHTPSLRLLCTTDFAQALVEMVPRLLVVTGDSLWNASRVAEINRPSSAEARRVVLHTRITNEWLGHVDCLGWARTRAVMSWPPPTPWPRSGTRQVPGDVDYQPLLIPPVGRGSDISPPWPLQHSLAPQQSTVIMFGAFRPTSIASGGLLWYAAAATAPRLG